MKHELAGIKIPLSSSYLHILSLMTLVPKELLKPVDSHPAKMGSETK
jgi:hypothetical protein